MPSKPVAITVHPERPNILWVGLLDGKRYHVVFPNGGIPWENWRTVKCFINVLAWDSGLRWPLSRITEPEALIYSRVQIKLLGDWPLYRPLAVQQPKMTSRQLQRWVGDTYWLTPKELKGAFNLYAAPNDLLLLRLMDLAIQFRHVLPELVFDEFLRLPWRRAGDWTGGEAYRPLDAVLNGNLRHVEDVLLNHVKPHQLLPYLTPGGSLANPFDPSFTAFLSSRPGLLKNNALESRAGPAQPR